MYILSLRLLEILRLLGIPRDYWRLVEIAIDYWKYSCLASGKKSIEGLNLADVRARAVASLLLPHLTSLPRVHTLPQDKPVSFPGQSHHQYQVMGMRREMAFIDCLVRMWVEYIASHMYGAVCRHGNWRA